jgi:hypothetical protein
MSNREINTDTRNFANEVQVEFYRRLTDLLFLCIEKNENLLKQYENLVALYGKDIINQDLGLLFKEMFNVDNLERNFNPESTLINSYTQHTTP